MKDRIIFKRDQTQQKFNEQKIIDAISQAMLASSEGSIDAAINVTKNIIKKLDLKIEKNPRYIPNVEEIQDLVENELMITNHLKTAKSYIIYRNKQAVKRERDIFAKRVNLKPYEYPELYEYVPAIRHSYWIHTEFNFTSDIQDFKARLTDRERNAIKNAMIAISQIEVAVKSFWGDIHKVISKPEVGSVGATFAESEVRHADAYSHLLEILGLNGEFDKIQNNPVLTRRVRYLEASLMNSKSSNQQDYTESVLLFSLFIEHVSLFSQFLIIMAFNKHRNMLKGISNVVEATSKEEQIHGDFGIDIINIIKKENPDWFDDLYVNKIHQMCKEAYESEMDIVNWIFEDGELDFIPIKQIDEFLKDRFNRSLESIGFPNLFDVDPNILIETEWFNDEIIGTKHGDFFVKRSINYSKRTQSITSDDLF
ncbi:MAG: ribonucleotide reductase [Flavobacteriales bacterium]|nr:ribonucleotide reductase [Flavobacteriales bacterium]|tara:strand:- start:9905 stop:11179 length:1275 start_codon:yes stop_codon:yes gene_type:complete